MKTGTVVILIIAAVLVIIGAILFTSALFAADFDFSKISSVNYQTNTYTADNTFENIIIADETADVILKASTDGTCRVECTENEKVTHSVTVDGGALRITSNDERKWYDHITFFGSNKASITVFLPAVKYSSLSVDITTGDVRIPNGFEFESVKISGTTSDVELGSDVTASLDINLTTGDVDITGISAGKASVTVTTGDIEADRVQVKDDLTLKFTTGDAEMDNVTCTNLKVKGTTGDVSLENVIVHENLSVNTGTGDVLFEDCDADEIYVKTTTGSVKGTLLTEKVFLAETSTGNVNVPKTTSGGKCEITTTTGDIRIRIE